MLPAARIGEEWPSPISILHFCESFSGKLFGSSVTAASRCGPRHPGQSAESARPAAKVSGTIGNLPNEPKLEIRPIMSCLYHGGKLTEVRQIAKLLFQVRVPVQPFFIETEQ